VNQCDAWQEESACLSGGFVALIVKARVSEKEEDEWRVQRSRLPGNKGEQFRIPRSVAWSWSKLENWNVEFPDVLASFPVEGGVHAHSLKLHASASGYKLLLARKNAACLQAPEGSHMCICHYKCVHVAMHSLIGPRGRVLHASVVVWRELLRSSEWRLRLFQRKGILTFRWSADSTPEALVGPAWTSITFTRRLARASTLPATRGDGRWATARQVQQLDLEVYADADAALAGWLFAQAGAAQEHTPHASGTQNLGLTLRNPRPACAPQRTIAYYAIKSVDKSQKARVLQEVGVWSSALQEGPVARLWRCPYAPRIWYLQWAWLPPHSTLIAD